MAARAFVLVARPDQREIVQHISAQIDVAAILVPTRRRPTDWPAPTFSNLESLRLDIDVQACCFLTPYAALKRDATALLERGVHVLCGGPISLSRKEFDDLEEKARRHHAAFVAGGRLLHSRIHQVLVGQRAQEAFGNPVYLRHVSDGGSGLLPAWWSICELLDHACQVLDADLKSLHLTAIRQAQKHHITLTAALSNRSNAQLIVAPVYLPGGDDVLLLGSGGLVYGESTHNALPLFKENGVQLISHPDQYAEPTWIGDFLTRLEQGTTSFPDWADWARQNKLLTAIRRALKQERPIPIKL